MQYISLGSTGLKVSRICLGCMTYGSKTWREWVLEEQDALPFYRAAWEAGINFYDTADVYSMGVSEEILGRAMKALSVPRERVVIATKIYNAMSDDVNDKGLSKKHIRAGIDASLKRLGTDYVDLYQIHRYDPHTPIEETCEALDECVRAGKVLHLGASSMYAWQFARMLAVQDKHGWSRFVSMQGHYNLVYREEEREMNPLCRAEGIGLIPWSPLARGFLAGNRQTERKAEGQTLRAKTDAFAHNLYYQPSDFAVVDAVTQVAEAKGVNNAQVALAWMLAQPGVTAPIIGASKVHHLEDALKSLEVTLSADEIKALSAPYQPHNVLGHS